MEGGGRFPCSRCSPRCRLPELSGAQALRSAAAARPRRRRPGAAGGGRGAARTAPRHEPAALRDEEIRAQPLPEIQKLLCKDGSVPPSNKPARPLYCLPLLHSFTWLPEKPASFHPPSLSTPRKPLLCFSSFPLRKSEVLRCAHRYESARTEGSVLQQCIHTLNLTLCDFSHPLC